MLTDVMYLDNNATTKVDDAVLAAMQPFFSVAYGNASSTHHFGAQLAAVVEDARGEVARLIGARPREIVFTSGGTESNNAALRGAVDAQPGKRHVVVSAVEHAAVLEPAAELAKVGCDVSIVPVRPDGQLDVDALAATVRDDTAVVSVMLANNETGVLMDVAGAAAIAHARGALMHADAVQAAGKTPIDVATLGVDLLALSAHKIHGPKGVGALYVRRGTPWRPLIFGGPHEQSRRGGTLNVPGIVGCGEACKLARERLADDAPRVAALRDRLEQLLLERCPRARRIAADSPRLPNTSCICVEGVEAEPMVLLLSEAGVCVSSGSACSSGSLEPSHVLRAMGTPSEVAQGQLRFSLSRFTTQDEIERVAELLPPIVERVAAATP